jgi:hypothetical protein
VNPQPRWLGWLLLAALGMHALELARTTSLSELLWSCHVATVCMAVGIFFRLRTAVAAGWLFHLSIGLPAWVVEIVVTRGTFGAAKLDLALLATSTLVHLLPIVIGAIWLRRSGYHISWRAAALAWVIYAAMIPLSRPFTPPELNINLAHGVWPALSHSFPRLWVFQASACAVCAITVLIIAMTINAMATRSFHARARIDPGG